MAVVLVVDDEPLLLDVYTRILSREGYRVFPASGPTHALELIQRLPPIDVVVSDIKMPEMPGTDLVCEVALRSPNTACILMTAGIVDPTKVPRGVPLLRKPVLPRDLISAIEEAVMHSAELTEELQASIADYLELRQTYTRLRAEHGDVMRKVADTIRGIAPIEN
jgi:DNA-binding NtrC family response regulator